MKEIVIFARERDCVEECSVEQDVDGAESAESAAFAVNGRWEDFQDQLSKGRPLIVALRPEGQSELHYVVVDGIDPAQGLVMINDPAERKLLTQERAAFEKDWSATDHWMLLAVPAPPSH